MNLIWLVADVPQDKFAQQANRRRCLLTQVAMNTLAMQSTLTPRFVRPCPLCYLVPCVQIALLLAGRECTLFRSMSGNRCNPLAGSPWLTRLHDRQVRLCWCRAVARLHHTAVTVPVSPTQHCKYHAGIRGYVTDLWAKHNALGCRPLILSCSCC